MINEINTMGKGPTRWHHVSQFTESDAKLGSFIIITSFTSYHQHSFNSHFTHSNPISYQRNKTTTQQTLIQLFRSDHFEVLSFTLWSSRFPLFLNQSFRSFIYLFILWKSIEIELPTPNFCPLVENLRIAQVFRFDWFSSYSIYCIWWGSDDLCIFVLFCFVGFFF